MPACRYQRAQGTCSGWGAQRAAGGGLIRDNRIDLAIFNAGVQVVVGVTMVWLGRVLAAVIWR